MHLVAELRIHKNTPNLAGITNINADDTGLFYKIAMMQGKKDK